MWHKLTFRYDAKNNTRGWCPKLRAYPRSLSGECWPCDPGMEIDTKERISCLCPLSSACPWPSATTTTSLWVPITFPPLQGEYFNHVTHPSPLKFPGRRGVGSPSRQAWRGQKNRHNIHLNTYFKFAFHSKNIYLHSLRYISIFPQNLWNKSCVPGRWELCLCWFQVPPVHTPMEIHVWKVGCSLPHLTFSADWVAKVSGNSRTPGSCSHHLPNTWLSFFQFRSIEITYLLPHLVQTPLSCFPESPQLDPALLVTSPHLLVVPCSQMALPFVNTTC